MPRKNNNKKKKAEKKENVLEKLGEAKYTMLGTGGDIWARSDDLGLTVLQQLWPNQWRCLNVHDDGEIIAEKMDDRGVVELCNEDRFEPACEIKMSETVDKLLDAVFSYSDRLEEYEEDEYDDDFPTAEDVVHTSVCDGDNYALTAKDVDELVELADKAFHVLTGASVLAEELNPGCNDDDDDDDDDDEYYDDDDDDDTGHKCRCCCGKKSK